MSNVPLARALAALALVSSVAACSGAATTSPSSAASGAIGACRLAGGRFRTGGSMAGGSASPASAGRPSSPAVVAIVSPTSGATVTGDSVHVVLTLSGAQIVTATTTNVRPDQGHIHLYVDNVLVSMNYGLEQDLPVHPGTYVLKAEFVAADHAPFNPRVLVSRSVLHGQVIRSPAIAALAAGLSVMALARVATSVGSPPLYDGVVVQEAYRYLEPAPVRRVHRHRFGRRSRCRRRLASTCCSRRRPPRARPRPS